MGYVQNNLINDEVIIYEAKVHWAIYIPGIILALLSIAVLLGGNRVFGFIILFFAISSIIKAVASKYSTDLVVTSKRVIAKFGFIKTTAVELNHNKVEGLSVHQSLGGKIFGYGSVIVNGTGGGKTPIPSIDHPFEFRKNAMATIDQASSS